MTSTESVIATRPLTIRRRVRFGDCDPAGIVYTVRFSDFVLSALDLFLHEIVGEPYAQEHARLGIHTPIKALNFVFRSALHPDDEFDMVVRIGEIRTRTFELHINAATPAGKRVFDAVMTPICVTPQEDVRAAIAIPAEFLGRLVAYRDAAGTPVASDE